MRSNLVYEADFQQRRERNFYWTPPFVVLVWPQKECGLSRRGAALLSLEPRESTGSVLGENWLQKQQKKKTEKQRRAWGMLLEKKLREGGTERNGGKSKGRRKTCMWELPQGGWEQRPCCVCSRRVPTKHLAEGGRRGWQGAFALRETGGWGGGVDTKRRSELVPGWKLCFPSVGALMRDKQRVTIKDH